MSNLVDQLFSRADVRPADHAACAADLRDVIDAFDAALPETLLAIWRRGNGARLDSLGADLLGSGDVLHWLENDAMDMQWAKRGLLPLLDDHESNSLVVCLQEPMAFRVVHVPHDNDTRVLYRDLDSCLAALIAAADSGLTATGFLHDTDGDYPPDAPRSEDDQATAKLLLAGPNSDGQWNHAVRLLDARNTGEWRKLLESNHFIRRDALGRLKAMNHPELQDLLHSDGDCFEAFVVEFVKVLRTAGLAVGQRHDTCVNVNGHWYEVEAFFHRRNIPDAMTRMVAWIRDQLAGEDPRARPGNFMAD